MTPIQFHTDYEPQEKRTPRDNELLHIYTCPFCEKEGKFHYFPEGGKTEDKPPTTWDCKSCGKKGNVYVFIQRYYEEVCTRNISDLKNDWDLPTRVFNQIKFSPHTQCHILPTFRSGKLNNLYKIVEKRDDPTSTVSNLKRRLYGTPGIKPTLNNWDEDAHDEIWFCEGQKDRLAALAIIGDGRDITPVATPGANVFNKSWLNFLQGKKLVLLFDNDDAGEEAMQKIIEECSKSSIKPAEIQKIHWPKGSKKGMDLYDLYQQNKGRSWTEIQQLLHPVQIESATTTVSSKIIADTSCSSYQECEDVLKQAYHVTRDMRTLFSMILASIFSIKVEGEQLWVKGVATPGAGKSRLAKAVSASDYVVSLSTFTGLFSGWQDGDDEDPSLVPEISGRTLIVKDADALLKQPKIEIIMSELRDFYDKDSSVRYGNRRSYKYQGVRSTFVMLGTQVLRRADQSFLGERLLTVEMDTSPSEERAITEMAMQRAIDLGQGKKIDLDKKIMEATAGFIDNLRQRELDSEITVEFQKVIINLCKLTALMRTMVDRDRNGKLQSAPIPELPTRLIGQIVTATYSLCAVYGLNRPTEEVHRIIVKVLRDTINPRGYRFQICEQLLENPNASAQELMAATGLGKNILSGEIRDMIDLNMLKTGTKASSSAGYSCNTFALKPDISTNLKDIING